ncbi:MAG TPA: ATP-binding cassette domain-containing protein, partial [Trebonia sp.]|nr:ATP-binding cassette domain-containing protein [Trebonia sp.]
MTMVPTPASSRTASGSVPEKEAAVRIVGLHKRFGDVTALGETDLSVRQGEFFTLLGPSGSGKTTLLRLIAGFEQPDGGTIELGGMDVTRTPPYARDV